VSCVYLQVLPRVPAVILVHGSAGVGANVDRWARGAKRNSGGRLLARLLTGRGIVQTVTDQSQLGNLCLIVDAYRALELLSKHLRIDASRIVLMGFPEGALWRSTPVSTAFNACTDGPAWNSTAYISFYPQLQHGFFSMRQNSE